MSQPGTTETFDANDSRSAVNSGGATLMPFATYRRLSPPSDVC